MFMFFWIVCFKWYFNCEFLFIEGIGVKINIGLFLNKNVKMFLINLFVFCKCVIVFIWEIVSFFIIKFCVSFCFLVI